MRCGQVLTSGRLLRAFPPITGSCTTPPKCCLRLIETMPLLVTGYPFLGGHPGRSRSSYSPHGWSRPGKRPE
jgi:hypothetical protein